MLEERGVFVDHLSINRWEIRFLTLLEKAFLKHNRPLCGGRRASRPLKKKVFGNISIVPLIR